MAPRVLPGRVLVQTAAMEVPQWRGVRISAPRRPLVCLRRGFVVILSRGLRGSGGLWGDYYYYYCHYYYYYYYSITISTIIKDSGMDEGGRVQMQCYEVVVAASRGDY